MLLRWAMPRTYPTVDQWNQLAEQIGPHNRFFHELRRRLLAIGFQPDNRYLMAVDRVCTALGSVAIHTHYEVCTHGGSIRTSTTAPRSGGWARGFEGAR